MIAALESPDKITFWSHIKATSLAGVLALLLAGEHSSADEAVLEAQRYLQSLGYEISVDGLMGPKTRGALLAFLESRGQVFADTVTSDQLNILAQATAPLEFRLQHPHRLFDTALGSENACFDLKLDEAIATRHIAPIPTFAGMPAFGDTEESIAFVDFQQFLTVAASYAAATGDSGAAQRVKSALLEWARADAGLGTVVDMRNMGAGNAEAYDPDAPGYFRNVELSMELGWNALVATSLIRDQFTDTEFAEVDGWYRKLIETYATAQAQNVFSNQTLGLFKLLNGMIPLVALAAIDGDEAAFREHSEVALANLLRHLTIDGYYLKNINRGDLALHLQGFGLLYTLLFTEILYAQGVDIYPRLQDRLHRAANFFVAVDQDNSLIKPFAQEGFNNSGRGDNLLQYHKSWEVHFWWMMVYAARFPDDPVSMRLRRMVQEYRESRPNLSGFVQAANWQGIAANCFYEWKGDPAAYDAEMATTDGSADEPDLDVLAAAVVRYDQGDYGANFDLQIRSRTGSFSYPARPIRIFAEYQGPPSQLRRFQILFFVDELQDETSRAADYSRCEPFVAEEIGSRMQLAFQLGMDEWANDCMLEKLGPNDARLITGLLGGFDQVAATLSNSGGSGLLSEVYSYVP